MFCNSSSRPAFNSSSGNFPLSAVRSRLRSTVGASHKRLLTAAIQPANELSFALDPCSDSPLLGVSAVKLDGPPGLIPGSPIFLFFKLASGSSTISSDASNKIASPLSNISCSILARQSSECCPLPTQPGHPCSTSVLVQNVLSQVQFFCTSATCQLILLLDGLVPAAYSVLSHSTDCQHTNSITAIPKHFRLQDASHNVSLLHLLASTERIHRCGQA